MSRIEKALEKAVEIRESMKEVIAEETVICPSCRSRFSEV